MGIDSFTSFMAEILLVYIYAVNEHVIHILLKYFSTFMKWTLLLIIDGGLYMLFSTCTALYYCYVVNSYNVAYWLPFSVEIVKFCI